MTKKQILTGSATSMLLLASAALAFAQTASTSITASTTVGTVLPPGTVTIEPTSTSTTNTVIPKPTPTPPGPPRLPMPTMHKEMRNMVQIGPEGNALLRGVVSAVGTNSITVASWGGVWTINIGADTQIMPKNTSTSLALIAPGDFVGVNGKIDTTQPWTVSARVVRDTDAEQRAVMMQKQLRMQMKDAQEKAQQNIKQLRKTSKEEIKNLRQKQEEERKKLKDQ